MGWLLLTLGGMAAFAWGAWATISGARLVTDTGWVEVPHAHREFAVQFESMRRAAVDAGTPEETAVPAHSDKKPGPGWYLLIAVGAVFAVLGAIGFLGEPTCGGEVMRPNDECLSYSGMVESTYEGERALASKGLLWGIAGVLTAIGAGIRIRHGNRALRRG